MLPPHAQIIGSPFGTEEEGDPFFAYIAARAADGVAWIDSLDCLVDNAIVIPGFEPQGPGAVVAGDPRHANFREGLARYARICHDAGAVATCQVAIMAGMPHSPSGVLKKVAGIQRVPHELNEREIRWMVEEYAYSVHEIKGAGLDGVEIHANNEDLLEFFMSPGTNKRVDRYGGSVENRLRFPIEVLEAVRAAGGDGFTVGIRMTMREFTDGGYGVDDGIELARRLVSTGLVDYLHGVVGNAWGNPTYNAPHTVPPGGWASVAGRYREALDVPIVYSGRIDDLRRAEEILVAGEADVIGVGRAMIADGQILSKSREGRFDDVRPCVGSNDCLHRILVEGLSFGCSVNPRAGYDHIPAPARAAASKRVLVIGGGPAGLEIAGVLGQRGHHATLWEREAELGGQLRAASTIPENAAYRRFVAWQERRLKKGGVEIVLGSEATVERVQHEAPDVVVLATGASPGLPDIPGVELPSVSDARDVLLGVRKITGRKVALVALEDHMQPITAARFLADRQNDLDIFYPTPSVAPLVGWYSLGGPIAKLAERGARFHVLEEVVAIAPGVVTTANIYSGTKRVFRDVEEVVFASSGRAESALYEALLGVVPEVHIIGDAYAPRRLSFATKQAHALGVTI